MIISAIAILGRGMLVTLYAHFAIVAAGWSLVAVTAFTAGLGALVLGSAHQMLRTGPRSRTYVPAEWAPEAAADAGRAALDSPAPVS